MKGYIPSKIDETHYILGASKLPQVVLRPSGDWSEYDDDKEVQSIQFETYNCTSFNTLSRIETLEYFLTGVRPNYSDRWLGIVAGTQPPGNDPQTICEAIRKHGLIPESMLPFSPDLQNVDEYYSFKGADEEACRKAGQDWLKKWNFGHEWVLSSDVSDWKGRMRLALTYSPLAGAVYAWEVNDKGIYIRPPGAQDEHWTGIDKDAVTAWDIQDSYNPFQKKLDPDFGFTYVKRFHMELKPEQPIEVKIGLYQWLITLLQKWIILQK